MTSIRTNSLSNDRLLADIGGTNARFAWQRGAEEAVDDVVTMPCAEFSTIADAIEQYLRRVGRDAPPNCAIAIANPVLGDQIQMTNHHWSFSISALALRFGFSKLRVLNDFTALALALPALPVTDLHQVGGGSAVPGNAIALIGPGTGLGVSGLVPTTELGGSITWAPLQGEGGHVTLAGCNDREHRVLAALGGQYGHVSAERAISGQGLVNLHRALIKIDMPDSPEPQLEAADITQLALRGDATCAEALDLFCAFLGTVAGNLALTIGARGGVYIGGGIVPRICDWFVQSPFRQRFEDKGRFRSYLTSIPVFVIHARQSPALFGAARALGSIN